MVQQHVRHRFAAYKLSDRYVGLAFNEEVVGRVNSMWNDDNVYSREVEVLRNGFVAGAEVIVSEDCRRQPDRFKDSAAILQPLIALQNALFKQWLHSQCHQDWQHYVSMRRTVPNSVRKAKNDWFQQREQEVEDKVM